MWPVWVAAFLGSGLSTACLFSERVTQDTRMIVMMIQLLIWVVLFSAMHVARRA